MTTPDEGATVSGLFWIEGTGTRVGVDGKVEVRIDSGDWNTAEGTASWRIVWDTVTEQDGAHTISARGTDASERTGDVHTVNVVVNNQVNSPPVVEPLDDRQVQVGQDVSFLVEANDPEGGDLTFSDDTDLFNINPTSGRVSFMPGEADIGTWHVEVTVSDGELQTKTEFIITVEPKEAEESILGFIPLTTTQLVFLLVLLVIVVVAVWVLIRSRRDQDMGDDPDQNQSRDSRGEAA